jgi:peptidoglycan hydrolase-like protein with peptidoglycan-binding domain
MLLNNRHGASPKLTVDGIFGNGTKAMVIRFQQAVGISADGIVGATTWKYLIGGTAQIPAVTTKPTVPVTPAPVTPVTPSTPTISPTTPSTPTETLTERQRLAQQILDDENITLYKMHVSGVEDGAQPYYQIKDTADGKAAKRSSYGTAPGGTVYLSINTLKAIILLSEKYDDIVISEIAGGSHSAGSWHYQESSTKNAVDVTEVNGKEVTKALAEEMKNYLIAQGFKFNNDPVYETSHIHLAFK